MEVSTQQVADSADFSLWLLSASVILYTSWRRDKPIDVIVVVEVVFMSANQYLENHDLSPQIFVISFNLEGLHNLEQPILDPFWRLYI